MYDGKAGSMEDLKNIINVVIVDDCALSRAILKRMIASFSNLVVCADFDNAEDCLSYISSNNVDLVLMDIGLPYMNGVDASKKIKQLNPYIRIIMLSSNTQDSEILSVLSANANAYVLKDTSQVKLLQVISVVLEGRIWIDLRIQHLVFNFIKFLPQPDYLYLKNMLNPTERSLISMVLKGFKKREVSRYLNVPISDLSCYVYSIFRKLAKTHKAENAVREFKYDLF